MKKFFGLIIFCVTFFVAQVSFAEGVFKYYI